VYRLIGLEGAKDTFNFLFNNLIKNNPELRNIRASFVEQQYHILLGATSRMQLSDIKEFIEIGTGMERDPEYNAMRKHIDIIGSSLGLKNFCQYVISKENLKKLEKIISSRITSH